MHSHFGRQSVIALTGVSRSQVDHWAKLGLVRPSVKSALGKGTRREYSFFDLVQFKVAKSLRAEGINLKQIRKSLIYLRKNLPKGNVNVLYKEWNTWFVFGKDFYYLTKDVNKFFNKSFIRSWSAPSVENNIHCGDSHKDMSDLDSAIECYPREVFCAVFIGEIIKEIKETLAEYSASKEIRMKVKGQEFTVVLTPDLEDGGYTIECKEIPAAISQGESEVEALDNIRDAIELCLEVESIPIAREK